MLNRTFKSSPDYTAPSLFKIGTGTTTPTISDTDLETPVNIDGDNFKSFVSGYPIINETNLDITFRCLVSTNEANGNSLTEFGIVNTDSTKKLFSRAVHTPISKTSGIIISYIEKDKF